jgi:hypothetical protein
MQAQQEAVTPGEATARPRRAASTASGVALIRRWAKAANASGSVSPAISASIIRRPDKPRMSEITEARVMVASASVFCSRWT